MGRRGPLSSLYRPFPDIACCHGSHHFRTIGSIVAGKKRAPAGVLASDVDLTLWFLHVSVCPQFPVVSSLICLALERTGMEEGITVGVIFLASCANCEDEGEVDRIRKRLQKFTVAELKAHIRRVKLPSSVHLKKKKKAEVVETLLELGQAAEASGQIKPSSDEDGSRTSSSLDCEANDLALTTNEWLQLGKCEH